MADLIGKGKIEHLCVNGEMKEGVYFDLQGPIGDDHRGYTRYLSARDNERAKQFSLKEDSVVFNDRSWSATSSEEYLQMQQFLPLGIPPGILLENLLISGKSNFSKLARGTQLVFPARQGERAIFIVTAEMVPCEVVARRLASHHGNQGLVEAFLKVALGRRGVRGYVFSSGYVMAEDKVEFYSA